jgi:dienelactone hydrolase
MSGPDSPFKASVQAHPGMIDAMDAARISIPVCMLASKDEDKGKVRAWEASLKVPSHVEVFEDQIHGWMSARGDLRDERTRTEYERGYGTFLGFLRKHL